MQTVFRSDEKKKYIAIRQEDAERVKNILEMKDIDFEGCWSSHRELYADESSKSIVEQYDLNDKEAEAVHDELFDLTNEVHSRYFKEIVRCNVHNIISRVKGGINNAK